jgi:hypothetical protein
VNVFLYVLWAFFGLGVICLILACTPWADGTPEPPACLTCSDPAGMGGCTCAVRCGHRFCRGRRLQATWNDDDIAQAAAMGIDLERSGQR